jgi:transcription initiation factor TFIIH subunit 3
MTTMMNASSESNSSDNNNNNSKRALLVIIVDVSPTTWGERDLKRAANDKARLAAGKRSVGPATLADALASVEAFAGAYCSLQEDGIVMIIGVAGNECAVVYPRKNELHAFFNGAAALDSRRLKEEMTLGAWDLVTRAATRAQVAQENALETVESSASIAAALSLGVCSINRFLVAANSGVSALANASPNMITKDNDGPVVSMATSSDNEGNGNAKSAWSPRILIVQASADRSRDYNAIMNCVFAASKYNIEINGCFIPSGISSDTKSSAFLEQACDRTNGVYLAPSGAAQVGGALTEVLLSVFLPPPASRPTLSLPTINKVDFRAQCFESGENVDMAFVCNQCLSIFKYKPTEYCPTCGANIKVTNGSTNKRRKESTV